MMNFIPAQDPHEGVRAMAERILQALGENQAVLWLVCGGSNIPLTVAAMELIRSNIAENAEPSGAPAPRNPLGNLIVAQTDERYGPIGHADSNWTQLLDAGFNAAGVRTIPVLVGKSLDATVTEYADNLKPVIDEMGKSGGLIVAQFGIGIDGHIAGMLPRSPAINDPRLVAGYEAGQYIRITLTAAGILKLDEAYVFAFGDSKKQALADLKREDLSLEDEPCAILKNIPKVFIWSDVIDEDA